MESTPFPLGTNVTFEAGPTRKSITAEVIGYENGFVITRDAQGKTRKARPSACRTAG